MERVCTLVVLVILIPCFTIQGQEQQEALCPSGWFKERSSCYKLSKSALNWQAAKKACEHLNSTLAIISSLAEHQALKRHIYGIRKNTWIGLHRDQNGWLWVDGSRLNDSHWGKGEPNNIDEECVEMRPFKPHNGGWNDQECSDTINYICEKDVNECASNPCKNGATCANTIEGFNCTCTKGFQGQICNKVVIKQSQVSPYSSTSLTAKSPQVRTLPPPNINHLPATSSLFHTKVMVSSSAHQSFLSSSSGQIKVAIKPSQVSPCSSKSLATQDTPVRILTSSNDIYFPDTSSLFHEGTVSSSVQPSAFPSSSVQMEVVITPRQVSPYSFTPLTAAQSPQVRTLLPPALHNYEVTVSSSAHQSTFPSSSAQMKVATKPSQVSPCSSKSLATQDTPVRILTSSNDIYFPDTSSLFHEGTVSSSVQPSAFPSSSVQMEVVITPRQVSPYSFTPLTAAQSPQVRTLLPPALHNYEVTVSSSAHQSTFPSSSVQMKAHKCSPQLSHGVSWETTDRGSTDKKPCPNGAEGIAKRKCSYDGTWENANFLNCRSAEYSKLISKMNAIASGSSNFTVPQVLAQLKNATKPTINSPERPSQIYGRDLIAAVEILAQITEYSKHRNVSSKEDFQNIAHVASNLLEPVNSRTWMALDKAHKNKSLILLSTLDSYGMEVSLSCEMSGKPNSVEAKNLLMMIEDRNCSVSRSRGNGSYISYSNTTIYLPSTVFSSPNSRAVTVIYLTLNDILALPKENADEDDKRILADTTIVSTVVRPKPPAVLRDPVKIVLKNRKVNTTSRKRCVFWRPDEPAIWGTSGCTLVPSESNASFTTCKCNHLTIFAALVDPFGRQEKRSHKEALEIISIVGCSISLVAVILTMILLSCFSRPLEAGVKVLINLCAAIAITCVLVIFEGLARRKAVCPVMAGLLHYFALALFSWMLCEGILHYLKVVKPLKYGFAVDDYVKYFYMCGWGFPAIIVSISLAVTQAKGYGSKATCWLDVKSGLIWTFIGPTLVVILINCVVLYLVMRKIMKPVKGKVEEKTQITKLKAGVRVSMAILPLVGITWVFGILSFSSYTIAFKYIFAIFNSLQGLMIFIFHCALNGKIKQAIRKRMMYRFKRGKLNHSLKVKEKGGNLLTNFTRKRSKCNEHECEVLPIRRDNVELNTLKDREDESLKTEDESLRRSLLSNSNE